MTPARRLASQHPTLTLQCLAHDIRRKGPHIRGDLETVQEAITIRRDLELSWAAGRTDD